MHKLNSLLSGEEIRQRVGGVVGDRLLLKAELRRGGGTGEGEGKKIGRRCQGGRDEERTNCWMLNKDGVEKNRALVCYV